MQHWLCEVLCYCKEYTVIIAISIFYLKFAYLQTGQDFACFSRIECCQLQRSFTKNYSLLKKIGVYLTHYDFGECTEVEKDEQNQSKDHMTWQL